MRDLEARFAQAIENFDFNASRQVIDDILRADRGRELAEYIETKSEGQTQADLRYRDHVFTYFHLRNIYFALRMTSYELLSKLSYVQTSEEGRQDAYDLIVSSVKSRNPTVRLDALDVEKISQNEYAVLLPIILKKRQEEIESVQIPYSQSSRNSLNRRYLLDEFAETYYGLKILLAAQENRNMDMLVGPSVFGRIEVALESMGVEAKNLLQRIPDVEWQKFVSDRERFRYHPGEQSAELDTIRNLFLAGQMFDLGRTSAISGAIGLIEKTKTIIYNELLKRVVSEYSPRDFRSLQLRSIEIIGERGSESDREFLAGLLVGDYPKRLRDASAKALSRLESRLAWKSKPEAPHPSPHINKEHISRELAGIVKDLMENIRKSNPRIVSDALVSLASVGGPNATSLLERLVEHPEPLIRYNVVLAAKKLTRREAFGIVKKALEDENNMVSQAAAVQLETRWPDHIIP